MRDNCNDNISLRSMRLWIIWIVGVMFVLLHTSRVYAINNSDIIGVWGGSYTGYSGGTQIERQIEFSIDYCSSDGRIEGFASIDNKKNGVYFIIGSVNFSTGDIYMKGSEWLNNCSNFAFAEFRGTISNHEMSGKVDGVSSRTFHVIKKTSSFYSYSVDYSCIPKYWKGEYDGIHGSIVVRRDYEISIDSIDADGNVEGIAIISPSTKSDSLYGAHGKYRYKGRIEKRTGAFSLQGYEWVQYPREFSNFSFLKLSGYIDKHEIQGMSAHGIWSMQDANISAGKIPISYVEFKNSLQYDYTGKKIVPEIIVVAMDGKELKSGIDYTASFKNNKEPGTATVIVIGKGKYTGTVNKTFFINASGKVTVKLNPNGGKVSKKSVSLSSGAVYGNLPKPTWKGYVFAGWYTAKKGGMLIDSTSYVTKPLTLYAHWSRAKYAITYNLNGGENSKKNPVSYEYNSAKITLASPTRTGYTFGGWYSDSKFKKKVTAIAKGSTGDKALYAKWTANKYTIKFNGNGATSGKMSSVAVQYGKKYTLPDNKYKKNGYEFLYWQVTIDGKGMNINNREQVFDLTSKRNAVLTFKAIWQKNINISQKDGKTVTLVRPAGSKEGFCYNAFYSDKYFSKTNSNAIAKSGLAKLSAVAALATYEDNGTRAIKLLKDCGFGDIRTPEIGVSTRGENHNASVYLGMQKLVDGSILVAVLINGYTAGGYEWRSNFELGNGIYHTGFDVASGKVVAAVKQYIQSRDLENVKLWITGHSRGAALTNMLAIKLIDEGFTNANRIYAYGFATPQYTTREGGGYDTIINYISPHDFVPYVAPSDWGYVRFGQNIVFDDTVSGTAISKYNSYSGTNLYFGSPYYRKELVKAFVKLGESPSEYPIVKSWPLGDTVTEYGKMMFSAKDVAQNGIALFMTKDKDEGLKNCLEYSKNSAEVLYLITLLGGGEKLMDYITDTHAMLMYLAWIDTYYPVSGQSIGLF